MKLQSLPLRRLRVPTGRHDQRGITLVETMVGLLLGLVTTVLIAQVVVSSETRRRGTAAGSDAQVNGALALYTLQRDIMQAGYGMNSSPEALGCRITGTNDNGATFNGTLAPVEIVAGANGAPDRISTFGSSKQGYALPARVTENHPTQSSVFFVDTNLGVTSGDVMIAVPPVWDNTTNYCGIFDVTQNANTNNNQAQGSGQGLQMIQHNPTGQWNQPAGANLPNAYPAGSMLVNLGQLLHKTYSVDATGSLVLTRIGTNGTSTTDTLYPNVVNLQAYFGKDTNGDGIVDLYDKVAPTTATAWSQLRTIRVATVVRTLQREKEIVTSAAPTWDVGAHAAPAGAAACGNSMCLNLRVNFSANGNEWQYYRYKVYDTVIPLRNLIWKG
jgi:type IV pilus assembly protein PilW